MTLDTRPRLRAAALFALLFAVTLVLRLCHIHLLWADEDYHLAAALQSLHGKLPYRDFWYDKPPLAAWLYAALGALPGWPLRLFGALYILAACAALASFARHLAGPRAALLAAGLLAFFLNFDLPAAVLPLAPDMLLLLPHIQAVHCAWKGKPLAAGLWCGVSFLFHTKGLFVLATCAVLAWRSLPLLALGFLLPNAAVFACLAAAGALPDYTRQVWQWGAAYAASSPEPHPWANGLRRTADWLGFHAALLLGSAAGWFAPRVHPGPPAESETVRPDPRYWMTAWLALSFAGVALGGRFFPRYFLLLLPPMVLLAATGLCRRPAPGASRYRLAAIAIALALLVPLVRFGPRYMLLARDLWRHHESAWADVALDRDSQAAAALVNARRHPGDTLFVWGYRPGIFVYTRLPADGLFWDSQPLTGVPADRHLRESQAVLPQQAARHRIALAATHPTFVVDSLSLANPHLALDAYPELRPWLATYRLVARTPLSLIYQHQPE